MEIVLSTEKQLEFLLEAVKESAQHTRHVLYALLATCAYVLLAAFSSRPSATVTLPVITATIDYRIFLAIAPWAIAALYLYLHIYIRDLAARLQIVQRLVIPHSTVPVSALIYPWIISFTLAPSTFVVTRDRAETRPTKFYIVAINALTVWGSAPVVLLLLWLRFLGRQDPISLLPCLALVTTLYAARGGATRSPGWASVTGVVTIILVIFSVASVPAMRDRFRLSGLWLHGQTYWESYSRIAFGAGLIFVGGLFGSQAFADVIVKPLRIFGTEKIEQRMKQRWSRIASRLARNPRPWWHTPAFYAAHQIANSSDPIAKFAAVAVIVIATAAAILTLLGGLVLAPFL